MRIAAIIVALVVALPGLSGCGPASPDFTIAVEQPVEWVYSDLAELDPAVARHISVPNPRIAVEATPNQRLTYSLPTADGRVSTIAFSLVEGSKAGTTVVNLFVNVPAFSGAHIKSGTTVSEARVEAKMRGWLTAYAAIARHGSKNEFQIAGMRRMLDALSLVTNPGMETARDFGDGRMFLDPFPGPPPREG